MELCSKSHERLRKRHFEYKNKKTMVLILGTNTHSLHVPKVWKIFRCFICLKNVGNYSNFLNLPRTINVFIGDA